MLAKKIKVLQLFDHYLPQTENWAYRLLSSLEGVDIYIGANHYLKNNFYNHSFTFINHHFGDLISLNRSLGSVTVNNLFSKILINGLFFPKRKVKNAFAKAIDQNGIQLIHCHFANVGWEFRNVNQANNIPLVISFYGWDYEKLLYTRPEFKSRIQYLFKQAAAFICEGSHGASILEGLGCPKEKISIVRLGINPSNISVVEKFKKRKKLKLLQLASFNEKKGHKYSIEAVSKIINECPNLELTFIGNENTPGLKKALTDMVKKLKLQGCIQFLPPVDYKYLYKTLAEYDVFIHPSCYSSDMDCEGGAPIVLLDAQAIGLPVISTTHCDIPEEVIHGKTGLLSPEKDSSALSKSIKKFYDMMNGEYQEFSQNARKHVFEHYDINKNARELIKLYSKVLNQN